MKKFQIKHSKINEIDFDTQGRVQHCLNLMREIHHRGPFSIASLLVCSITPPAQFRTCLWLRAGRWISGQEAGKTPTVLEVVDGNFHRLSLRGPAAGGENRRPCPKQVTQLKATTERAFLGSC
jgi:hypothetical protein